MENLRWFNANPSFCRFFVGTGLTMKPNRSTCWFWVNTELLGVSSVSYKIYYRRYVRSHYNLFVYWTAIKLWNHYKPVKGKARQTHCLIHVNIVDTTAVSCIGDCGTSNVSHAHNLACNVFWIKFLSFCLPHYNKGTFSRVKWMVQKCWYYTITQVRTKSTFMLYLK